MTMDGQSDFSPRPGGRRWKRRALLAGPLAFLVLSLLAVFLVTSDSTADNSASLVSGLFFAVASGAVLFLALVVPRIGREQVGTMIEERLDDQSLDLLDRATNAIAAIDTSLAQERGFLDGIANTLVLQEQTSEIAEKLALLSGLRRDEKEIGATSPAALARLERQRAALDGAAASLTRRIEALESYAEQVAELDAMLHETTVMERLDERDAAVAELVAETARDQPAVEDVDRLARGLPAISDELERRLRAVREGGQRFLDTD